MAKIDPVKKRKYKSARNEGKSIRESLEGAGYTPATAKGKNGSLGLVKVCEAERLRAVDKIKYDEAHFLNTRETIKNAAFNDKDYSGSLRAVEGQERIVGIGKEEKTQVFNIFNTQDPKLLADRDQLTELIRNKTG